MMIKRTYDINEINYVLRHPSVKPFIGDDFSGGVEYPIIDNLYYLAAYEEGNIIGLVVFYPLNGVTVEGHIAYLPEFYGEKARKAATLSLKWIFDNTDYRKINGNIPVYNKLALKFAESIGLSREGINKMSFMKNGKLYDQIYFGVERESCQ